MKAATYRATLRCIAGCHGEHSLLTPIYRCPTCNDLLEVSHDLDALRERSPGAWMRLFDDRYKRTTWPYGSAVWGKKEWVCPEVHDDNIVSMDEGGTNLFWAERLGQELGIEDLWVKLCGNSHTGSFKDLGMTVLVSIVREMMQQGAPIRAVACASTGDTSASLAAYAAAGRIPAVVILPRGKVSTAQLVQPLSNGATVLSLDTDFDGCMAIVQRLATEEGIYLANSMNSVRLEGQKTVGVEIVQQFDWEVPDVIIIPGGNLGNVSALGAGFDMMETLGVIARRPRIVVAQGRRGQPPVPGVSERLAVRTDQGDADASIRHPDRQPRLDRQGGADPQAVSWHRGASDRGGAGRRRRAGGPYGHVQLPAHWRRACRDDQAPRAGRDHPDRPRRRHLDRERTEVHRFQAAIPPEQPPGPVAAFGERTGGASRRLRRRASTRVGVNGRLSSLPYRLGPDLTTYDQGPYSGPPRVTATGFGAVSPD